MSVPVLTPKQARKAPNLELRVGQYVTLRDQIRELEDAHKAAMEPFKTALEKLAGVLLQALNTINAESVKTDTGTVYKTTKKSVSIADLDTFWKWVQKNDAYDLLDKKANVKAVEEYLDQHQKLPPGLNWSAIDVVGVRRPTS